MMGTRRTDSGSKDKARDFGEPRNPAVGAVLHHECVHVRGAAGQIAFVHLKVKRARRVRGSVLTSQAFSLGSLHCPKQESRYGRERRPTTLQKEKETLRAGLK